MSHSVEILEGAFILSDAHYSHLRPQFLDFLKEIDSNRLQPTQLILMGDIFDTLFAEVIYTQDINQEAIELLNKISLKIEVIYLEGNHDFNLKNIFKHVKVFPISAQPLTCKFNNKRVLLSHGDIESPFGYRVYTSIIRNSSILKFLALLDLVFGNFILKQLDVYLSKKDDCKEFEGFKEFIANRLANKYSCDYFIEGHYHQNKTFKFDKYTYINLGAFACNQRYFIVESSKEVRLLEERIFSKEKL